MGLRRLRARLDQLQGNANNTMGLAQDLIADLKDGVGVTISVDEKAVLKLLAILAGKPGELPIKITIDPSVDKE